MKYKFLRKFVVLAAIAAVFSLQSCSDDPEPVKPGQAGFYIVNEGGFPNANTSISFYDRSTNTVNNDIFALTNGRPLGDQSQSMTIIDGKGYIVVQGSGKIEVINADDYSSIATITDGLVSPRYILGVSAGKAYVTDWGVDDKGVIRVLNLATNQIVKTIVGVGIGTNRIIKVNNMVYVTNSGSFTADDNTVQVINPEVDTIIKTLEAGDNPNSLAIDKNGNLWVANTGNVNYLLPDYSIDLSTSTPGSITKFNADLSVAFTVSAPQVTDSGINNLSISNDGTQLYYLYGTSFNNQAIYTMSTSATSLPTTPFKPTDVYYGLAIDPFDGSIIACKAPNYSSAGSIDIIDANGTVKSSFTTGIAPNGCAFK